MNGRPAGRLFRYSLAILCALVLPNCSSCSDRSLAELSSTENLVERDFARTVNAWSRAEPGARFAMGDGLRTGKLGSARLALTRGGVLLVKSDTIMRFVSQLADGKSARDIEITSGELTIETGQLDFGIRTPRGLVKVSAQSTVSVRAQAQKVRFDVMVGRAEAASQSAHAGQSFELEILVPTVERPPAVEQPAAPPSAAVEPASEPQAGPLLRELQFQDAPTRVSFSLPAGESATIHDPAPPTALRITETRCAGQAVLEFDRGNGRFDALRVRGTGEPSARLGPGNYRYRVRCVRNGHLELAAVSSGRLNAVRDAAVRPLPLKPVSITADADGRRYTVSYQNRLPIITLRWTDPPKSDTYTLRVQPEHDPAFTLQAKQPSVTLPAGRLGEGTHRFEFTTANAHSEQGLLGVTFDYRARTAYLTSPSEGQVTSAAPSGAHFAGGTLIGSTVSIQGQALKLDAQGRFAADVALPVDADGLALRVMHPSTGIHYYIRHLAHAP